MIMIIIIIINDIDEVLVIPSLEADHATNLPKKTCSNLCMQKQDQFTIDELLYKNKISHGTLMIFLYFKRY